jgi:hypothetical protein
MFGEKLFKTQLRHNLTFLKNMDVMTTIHSGNQHC